MNERSAGILLHLALTINIITAQIHYPVDIPVPQRTRNTENHVSNIQSSTRQISNPSTNEEDSYNQYLGSIISHGFSKLILDVNRITQAVSPEVAKADYVVYGPVTISGALSLALLASIGRTFDEIANCLGISSIPNIQNDPLHVQQKIGMFFETMESRTGLGLGHTINFANALFLQQDFPIRPAYQELVEKYYKSNVMNLDFIGNPRNAKHVINTWVSGRTHGKIPSLLDEPPPTETTAIIASVLYFQASWEYPFFNGHTKLHQFYANGRKNPSTKMAEMMSNGGEFPYYREPRLGAEIMGFPYKGNQTTMYVIMPFDSNKEKLRQLESSLTPEHIDYLVNSTRYTEAVILFPKMKLESTIDLRSTLQRMGVNALFDPARANLALLSPGVNQRFNEAGEAPFVSPPIGSNKNQAFRPAAAPPPQYQNSNSQVPEQDLGERLIFTRFNEPEQSNCTPVYDPATDTTTCQVELTKSLNNLRNKRASSRRSSKRNGNSNAVDELEKVRQQVTQSDYANPGLYADQVIHKVYIDITESGTEAAAATGISLNRSGGRVTFRVDVPFLFFIYHEESKVILFWGSVKSPAPSVST